MRIKLNDASWLALGGLLWLGVSCGKKPGPATAAGPETNVRPVVSAAPANPVVVPATAAADSAAVLEALTQAVRRYAVERQVRPRSLAEVVAAGYVSNLPAAPAGRRFEIDQRTSRVVLVNQ
ncbi:MAG TPA: hypothetical protein VFV96_11135 [Verrucomicrobiae bacterium]|nr:hypothetical protein [Verrucomicrobiae bacterium]